MEYLNEEDSQDLVNRITQYLINERVVTNFILQEFSVKFLEPCSVKILLKNGSIALYLKFDLTKETSGNVGEKILNHLRSFDKKKESGYIQIQVPKDLRPEVCPVCSDSFDSDALSCGHWICTQCIINSCNETCPLCKSNLILSEEIQVSLSKRRNLRDSSAEANRHLINDFHDRLIAYLTDFPDSFVDTEVLKLLKGLEEDIQGVQKKFILFS